MKKVILILIASLFLLGCKTKYIPLENSTDTSVTVRERLVTVRDTVVIPDRSSYAEALLRCDSMGQVMIDFLNINEAEKLRLQLDYDKVKQLLRVRASTPKDTVYLEKIVLVSDTTRTVEKSNTVLAKDDGMDWKSFLMVVVVAYSILLLSGVIARKLT